MPWLETDPVKQRQNFVRAYLSGDYSVLEMSEAFGVSPKTCHKWIARFREEGLPGLIERSRARKTQSHRTSDDIRAMLLATRRAHPRWGPKKLVAWLSVRHPRLEFPAPSTAGQILKQAGLVPSRRRSRRRSVGPGGLRPVHGPNATWCADYKGQFRLGDGSYCYPATITDAFSRKLLRCTALKGTFLEETRAVFESAFHEFGLPSVVRTDNGPPFAATHGALGISRLSVWLIEHDVQPEFIRPGHPQENGRHERMHKTLKAEATVPAAPDIETQQERFDEFRAEFNDERPHEALGQRTPTSAYTPSMRTYVPEPSDPKYPPHAQLRRVTKEGTICWGTKRQFLSSSLAGKVVALEPIDDGLLRVQFHSVVLGYLDDEQKTFVPNAAWHQPTG